MMKKTMILVMWLITVAVVGQQIPSTTTYYSKTNVGRIGSDEKTFYISNSYMYKVDKYYGTTTSYGPLKLHESGYNEDGYYYETFSLDILSDPKGSLRKKIMAYQVLYDRKGGTILVIVEITDVNKSQGFYTIEGYKIYNNQ